MKCTLHKCPIYKMANGPVSMKYSIIKCPVYKMSSMKCLSMK